MRWNLTRDRLGNQLLEWIWPASCPLCAAPSNALNALCLDCWQELPILIDPKCSFCGAELESDGAPICSDCYLHPRSWDYGSSLAHYQGSAQHMVIMLKSMKSEQIAAVMANLIYRHESEIFEEADCLVPIPIHWSKQITRGFNQAALMAYYLSKRTGLEFCDQTLRRVRATKAQVKLKNFEARFENLEAVIEVARLQNVQGRRVLLIDDVMTSGASFEVATKALKNAGASSVGVLSFARAGLARAQADF